MSCTLGVVELGWGEEEVKAGWGTLGGPWIWLLDVHNCAEAEANPLAPMV